MKNFAEFKATFDNQKIALNVFAMIRRDMLDEEADYYNSQTPENKARLRLMAGVVFGVHDITLRGWGFSNVGTDEVHEIETYPEGIAVTYMAEQYSMGCNMGYSMVRQFYPSWLIDASQDALSVQYTQAIQRYIEELADASAKAWDNNEREQEAKRIEKAKNLEEKERKELARLQIKYKENV